MINRSVVRIPQEGANDEVVKILGHNKTDGATVAAGEVVATVETTKAVIDVTAEAAGRIFYLKRAGEELAIGGVLAVISQDPTDTAETVKVWVLKGGDSSEATTVSVRQSSAELPVLTRKAELLATQLGISREQINQFGRARITEADIKELYEVRNQGKRYGQARIQPARIVAIGGGRGCIQLLDALSGNDLQRVVAILDDTPELRGAEVLGIPVHGQIILENMRRLLDSGIADAAVISVSTSIAFRRRLFMEWHAAGIPFATVIHPRAHVGISATLGEGNVVLAFCHIGAFADIGNNNFLSPYVDIEHHCRLGSHCSFGPAVCFSSNVEVADAVRFGTGVFIEPHVKIGSDCVIASGSILTNSVPANSTVKVHANTILRLAGGDNPGMAIAE